jgi:type II secretory ATPase GspE/PulE/Tfp pilus assembly ATPase PilB-like protein
VLLQFAPKKLAFKSLDEIGMRTKMQEQLAALLEQNGLFVFSSMPGGGLSTTIDVVLSNTDRFIRNFVAVADESKPEREIENVHVTTYSSAAEETPMTVLPKLIRTYPDVIVVRDVADLDTLATLCEQAGENRLVLTSTRAKEATEALLRIMLLKIPPADFAGAVTGVLNVRLVRKLCEACKEAYPPPAEVLKQLGLPPGRVESLYRPPTEPIDPKRPDVVCEECRGIGYHGRTGIFELLLVDETIRQVLTSAPKMENLRAAARKAKHRALQEEGVLLVARGVTSIQELLRVLKQ